MSPTDVDVLVIGAGQAGLSAGYHLGRRGFSPLAVDGEADGDVTEFDITDIEVAESGSPTGTFVILDANPAAGGAWQHRWDSLRMSTVNGIHELPDMPVPPADPQAPANLLLPDYFAAYEHAHSLPVVRPVRVESVSRVDADPYGRLSIRASDGRTWTSRYVINATGTWTRPFVPYYPGVETFAGRYLHVRDYRAAGDFAGQRVAIVGAGVSALQLLDEISAVTDTLWFTKDEPVWQRGGFDEAARIMAIDGVAARAREGILPGSIVSVTGMHWSPWVQSAHERGALVRLPMFVRIEENGLRMADGSLEPVDVILWATGFRPAIDHLAPLGLRTREGGVRVDRGRAIDEPRLFLIGYGPSQSTIGANRAGRDAVRAIVASDRLHDQLSTDQRSTDSSRQPAARSR